MRSYLRRNVSSHRWAFRESLSRKIQIAVLIYGANVSFL
jgi:hypothetical protein